ncbi:cAMP-independent regulatory protein pac2 [Pleurostoma richardsiae]|uniref:cAMP-independent regulatory protein pac2 n=1 Tax=Pleurostoma richardsiae TaxID=41990 RepID=A0AA38RTY8_9PEZI|nr:cAMP-independent regulatory protein pac2 [Pleurostoma richardsiae]
METYYGYVRSPADAIKLFEACRVGLLPRVQRRLSEKERQSIRSGSVFVWDEREAGMRRWTDGKSWSASRVSGSFLTYREMEGKRGGGFGSSRRGAGKTPDSGRGSDEDQDDGEPDGYRYKADGLMKQSFSITTSTGQHLHLISYYSRPHPGQPELPQPSTDPQLRGIIPTKGMYPESSMNEAPVPALTKVPMIPAPHYAPVHGPTHYPQTYQYMPWPPSPVATPPYSHYNAPSPYGPALPPINGQYALPPTQPPLSHNAAPSHPAYDRAPLPPPGAVSQPPRGTPPSMPLYTQPTQLSPHLSQPRPLITESPRTQHLQAQAAAVMVDPRLAATSARNPQGPLPALGPGALAVSRTTPPPPRALSQTPPGSSHSNGTAAPGGGNKASLSALLHPTPIKTEPTGANSGVNSAGSSPRQAGMAPSSGIGKRSNPFNEDARALQVLDKKFCI